MPNSVNADGVIVGSGTRSDGRAARLRLGGTPEFAGYYTYLAEINAAGDAVGSLHYSGLGTVAKAVWWPSGADQPVNLPGPVRAGVTGIDDLGYKVGYGAESGGEQRRELVWDANGQLVRQFGPYADNETALYLADVDNGVAIATRYHPNGTSDLATVDVRTGAVTPLPDTDGVRAEKFEEGWVVGEADDFVTPVLWHDGARVDLPAVPGTTPRRIEDVKVFGSTAVLSGFSWSESGDYPWFMTPTVWRCG